MKNIFSRYVEARSKREIRDFNENGIGKTVGFQPSAKQAVPAKSVDTKSAKNIKKIRL